jgi:ketosteroid isomerase-like protein
MESGTPSRDTAWAMSEENVEIVCASLDTWNAGDMDASKDFVAPDVVWRPMPDWPESGPFIGREATLRQAHRLRDDFDADTAERISVSDAADRVVVRLLWRLRGNVPQLPESEMQVSLVYTVRKRKISAFEFFWDHAEALEAAGLSE